MTVHPVICKGCGSIDDYRIEVKASQHTAWCNGCDAFIKNIPYKEPSFYVGKYKGIPIANINDVNYLEWAQRTMKLSAGVRDAINYRLHYLQNLAR